LKKRFFFTIDTSLVVVLGVVVVAVVAAAVVGQIPSNTFDIDIVTVIFIRFDN